MNDRIYHTFLNPVSGQVVTIEKVKVRCVPERINDFHYRIQLGGKADIYIDPRFLETINEALKDKDVKGDHDFPEFDSASGRRSPPLVWIKTADNRVIY